MHVFYLHGFASSARSSKAAWLAERLRACGLSLHCPDFNEPDFETLTTSRMLDQLQAAIGRLPPAAVTLVGSSLGGFVAWHAAARQRADDVPPAGSHPISRLVLLAPALDFGTNRRMGDLDEAGMARWRETGHTEVVHHAFGERRRLGYGLYADAARYDSFAVTDAPPTIVFQGRTDEVVDPAMVERFVRARHGVEIRMLDDGHQLHASLEVIWRELTGFLDVEGMPA